MIRGVSHIALTVEAVASAERYYAGKRLAREDALQVREGRSGEGARARRRQPMNASLVTGLGN